MPRGEDYKRFHRERAARLADKSDRQEGVDRIEARARHIAGASHHRGAIPARAWRQAIAERFFGEPIRDPEWVDRFLAWCRATSTEQRESPE